MIVVGITGASGVIYGIKLLEALKELNIESALVISDLAKVVIESETDYTFEDVIKLSNRMGKVAKESNARRLFLEKISKGIC